MAKQTINNGESGLSVRNKLNGMLTELYDAADTLGQAVLLKSDKTHSHDSAYEPKDPAIQEHIQTPHAPANANYYQHPTYHPLSMINGAGTAAGKDTGTEAGNVVEVQEGGKLPALNAENLSGIPAGSIVENENKKVLTADERTAIAENTSHRNATGGNPHGVNKGDVDLGNVDNTADADKPISTATQAALDLKVEIESIIDNLTTANANLPLSANQGLVLKGLIDNLTTLVTSDDTTLDTLQEIVDFIKLNRDELDALTIGSIAGLQNALDAKEDSGTADSVMTAHLATYDHESLGSGGGGLSEGDVIGLIIALG